MDEDEKTPALPEDAPAPSPPQDEAWRREIGDLRTSVQRMEAESARKDQELAYLRGRLEASAKPEASDELADIPDDEFLSAVDQGDTQKLVAAIRKQAAIIAKREVKNLRDTDLAPLRDRFENFGLPVLSDHTLALSRSEMPHLDVPEVARAMDTFLSSMSNEQKANKQGLMTAYQLAVGANPMAVVEFERKKAERQALTEASDGGGRVTNTRHRSGGKETFVPLPGDLGGQDAERAAQAKGGHDALARKLGYNDWADYMKQTGMVEGAQ